MRQMIDWRFVFDGICPYTDKPCEIWNCPDCETHINAEVVADNLPTVDAIPIEWINDWYEKYQYAEVGDLLNDWVERKEHDGRND